MGTVIVTDLIVTHPFVPVTVTVLTPVVFITTVDVEAPVLQEYVPPPVAVNVVVWPGHICKPPVIFTIGLGIIVTVTDLIPLHPNKLVRVTVYTPPRLVVIEALVLPVFQR